MTTENTERDELAGIARQLILNPPNTAFVTDAIADAILAAGYTKPRQVTTVAELDALPVGAAILTAKGCVYLSTTDRKDGRGNLWQGDGAGRFYGVWFEKSDSLPATVLYSPVVSGE